MAAYSLRFLKASLIYLLTGALLGVLMGIPITRDWLYSVSPGRWSLAHAHLNLAGFLLTMVFGIAYHVLPRFNAHMITHNWPMVHFYLSTVGTPLMVTGFVIPGDLGSWVVAVGGAFQFIGICVGFATLWRVMTPQKAKGPNLH